MTACEPNQYILIIHASCQQNFVTYNITVCTVKNALSWTGNCPKHVVFYSENKFEKLVHPVGFIIRILHG